MDFRDLYKNRKIPTLSATITKYYQDIITSRQIKQKEFFWSKRGQPEITSSKNEALEKKKNARLEMLKKWKAEKLKKQEEEKKKCKPIFKVGVVQKKVTGSPLLLEKKNYKKNLHKKDEKVVKPQIKMNEKNYEGIMTRSRTRIQKTVEESTSKDMKQLNTEKKEEHKAKTDFKLNNKFCKVEVGKIKKVNSVTFKVPEQVAALPHCNRLTFPNSPNFTKKKKLSPSKPELEKTPFSSSKSKIKMCFNTNENVEDGFKSLEKMSETPQSSEPKNSENDASTQIHYSPFGITENEEKEKNNKMEENKLLESETENKENEFQNRIFSFREYIDCKTKMLLGKCEEWEKNCINFEGPSDIEGEIGSVIGKTKLLTSDKFLQFKSLIDKCEAGDPLINLDDLEGFKDWVSIEVEKISETFLSLEKQKSNNWVPENLSVENSKNKKKQTCITKKPLAKSNIRQHILAARKMLKNEKRDLSVELTEIKIVDGKVSKTTPTPKRTVESPEENGNISNLNRFLPVKGENCNSNLEVKTNSPRSKIPFTIKNSPVLKGSGNKNVRNKIKAQASILNENFPNSGKRNLNATPKVFNSSIYISGSENMTKGLSEKYFRRPEDHEKTPVRTALGVMDANITPVRITRSKRDTYQNFI